MPVNPIDPINDLFGRPGAKMLVCLQFGRAEMTIALLIRKHEGRRLPRGRRAILRATAAAMVRGDFLLADDHWGPFSYFTDDEKRYGEFLREWRPKVERIVDAAFPELRHPPPTPRAPPAPDMPPT